MRVIRSSLKSVPMPMALTDTPESRIDWATFSSPRWLVMPTVGWPSERRMTRFTLKLSIAAASWALPARRPPPMSVPPTSQMLFT